MAAVALLMTGCVSTIDGQPSLAGGGAADVEEVFEQVEAPEIGTCPDSPYPGDPLSRQPYVEECTDRVIDYLEGDVPNGYAVGVYLPLPED